ncbi:helix-turn-helix domain containing protein [bacterium]|nr:helix-turn-helix domain containing protein [bacterium]
MSGLSFQIRQQIVEMVENGITAAQTAHHFGIARDTVTKWCNRFIDEGEEGLHDRSSAPHSTPHAIAGDNRDLIIKTALEYPEKGIQWLSEELKIASPSTIQNILKESDLGHRIDRLECLFSKYREKGESALSEYQLKGMAKISPHFRARNLLSTELGSSFFVVTMKQPVSKSRRRYEFTFFIDSFDMTASCVIDSREFWDPGLHRSLQYVYLQQELLEGSAHRLTPNFLTWDQFIFKRKSNESVHFTIPFLGETVPRHLHYLAKQIRPLNITLSALPSAEFRAIPFVRMFLDQFKTFRRSTLDQGIYLDQREGLHKPSKRCEELVVQFLDTYNQKSISDFPHFGYSPVEYRNIDKPDISEHVYIATVQRLLRTIDRTKPLPELPTISEAIESAIRIGNEQEIVYVNENQLELGLW